MASRLTSISALGHGDLSLPVPLLLSVQQCDEHFVVKWQQFGLYADSETASAAIDAFRVVFVALHRFLTEN